ncbi:hypothetical protein ES705_10661 [subsurface metagenome]
MGYGAAGYPDTGIPFIIDGGGSVITAGEKGHVACPYNGDIEAVELLADQSGSIVVDIWKGIYDNFPPTDAGSITGSSPPTISSAQKSRDTTLTGWTKPTKKGEILAFNVDSCTTITRVTVMLFIKR